MIYILFVRSSELQLCPQDFYFFSHQINLFVRFVLNNNELWLSLIKERLNMIALALMIKNS